MNPGTYQFDAAVFVSRGQESEPGEWTDEDRQAIGVLRANYPELSHWGDLALGSAFGSFSQYVLEVNWADWMVGQRDEIFLNYCWWRQTRGQWSLGLDEVRLAEASEWKAVAAHT